MDAFFVPEGDLLRATPYTRGPWSAKLQHGGPPSALLARAIEQKLAEIAAPSGTPGEATRGAASDVARLTVDFVRPIPVDAAFRVRADVVRAGRQVQEIAATLATADGTIVCRASAIAIRRADVPLPQLAQRLAPPPGPEASAPFAFPFFADEVGYHRAFDGRLARGPFGAGACAMWFRLRVAIVAGEAPSPLQRVAVAADSGNGVSLALDTARYTFVNPDLTICLHRQAEGEWVCLDARTTPEPHGIGLAEAALFDARGAIGRSLQTLVVAARG